MKGDISCFSDQKNDLIRRQASMNTKQFEVLKKQIKYMTPCQLRTLKTEISQTLEEPKRLMLTDEEQQLIASLFR
ncbi:hypothetical protein GCM10007938_30070 [Vibrio zhanjiangensis]|uniref:Uncharacterized protein n=2 Tax=Vibrio zhanjiangensis TaxID=1046128 RepID=A0ABQ6F1A0_9VIBR|nr:hypothetical protein GCM10007938_30070 [Vibrio zhanjiangensis]